MSLQSHRSSAHITSSLFLVLTFLPLAMPWSASAQTYTESVVYAFPGGDDGVEPLFSGVIRDAAGNFYGTTYSGGAHNHGTVFKIDTEGHETVLYDFTGKDDGGTPYAGLIRDAAGNLYGTASIGGEHKSEYCNKGCGVVFKIDAAGKETVLHSFTGKDGGDPLCALIADAAGNLYGTTEVGGSLEQGTVFKLDPAGRLTVLHSFGASGDGAFPMAGVIRDSEGNLYGTTQDGGLSYGTVFKIDANGKETVLHSFAGTEGNDPRSRLYRDGSGILYGTTFFSDNLNGVGTVFKVEPSGRETVLHTFDSTDGAYPEAGLIADASGNLYGTTTQGGPAANHGGTVYRITPEGVLTTLYDFTGGADGANPAAALLMDSDGNFYSTTSFGGVGEGYGNGTIFELTQ